MITNINAQTMYHIKISLLVIPFKYLLGFPGEIPDLHYIPYLTVIYVGQILTKIGICQFWTNFSERTDGHLKTTQRITANFRKKCAKMTHDTIKVQIA